MNCHLKHPDGSTRTATHFFHIMVTGFPDIHEPVCDYDASVYREMGIERIREIFPNATHACVFKIEEIFTIPFTPIHPYYGDREINAAYSHAVIAAPFHGGDYRLDIQYAYSALGVVGLLLHRSVSRHEASIVVNMMEPNTWTRIGGYEVYRF